MLFQVDLAKVCWRLRDLAVYQRVIATLRGRLWYNDSVWSYSVFHKDGVTLREFLAKFVDAIQALGPAISTPIVTVSGEIGVGSEPGDMNVIALRSSYEHTGIAHTHSFRVLILVK